MSTPSESARSFLSRAGWYPGREIETQRLESELAMRGYHVGDQVRTFLREFGNLRFENPAAEPPAIEDWHFDPMEAAGHTTPGNVRIDSTRVGSELCPIGEAQRGYLVLMMDQAGRVFGSYDALLAKVGDTGLDAIEGLCTGRALKPVDAG